MLRVFFLLSVAMPVGVRPAAADTLPVTATIGWPPVAPTLDTLPRPIVATIDTLTVPVTVTVDTVVRRSVTPTIDGALVRSGVARSIAVPASRTGTPPLIPGWALDRDSAVQRPHAVEYSDWYGRRLMIHRIGSWIELPLFAAQYAVGQRLINGANTSWVRPAHGALATSVAILFGANTLTGAWNLWDSRHDPAGRPRRFVHAALLMAADAGFVWTGLSAGEGDDFEEGRMAGSSSTRHRSVAIGSMAIATAGTVMMWLWKD